MVLDDTKELLLFLLGNNGIWDIKENSFFRGIQNYVEMQWWGVQDILQNTLAKKIKFLKKK